MQVASGYIPHFQALKDAKTQSSQEAKPLRFLQKVEKPVLRPPTPSIHTPQEVCVCVTCKVIFVIRYCLVMSKLRRTFCTRCRGGVII